MATVDVIPKIRCDNCGFMVEKHRERGGSEFNKPSMWGSIHANGGRSTDSYGGKERLDFADLCQPCACAALDAAAAALKQRRGE
ncbi:hypothetical protein EN781_00430 [Mesorhizobium sp. M4A.F.Ca.ET.090.04.2.1]|uniref:hypothetical protein n=1 Tax=Mesorhizobium sp. M4A.F.Ca.ET.090.04.2.1 TaxID=2496663 RepID=UPI000FCBD488|nr:hypothetical protein [Mesorhizobium sp. M4A.F.Ca.ET.090.04.2.1]RVC47635.1 hypothetical protein EN781_00430 [Mesorhizobium sp. M4A.F.Ca.ET.090.04.2.1]